MFLEAYNMKKYILILGVLGISIGLYNFKTNPIDSRIVSHIVDISTSNLKMFYKDTKGNSIGNFKQLNTILELKGQRLRFGMNGGMYLQDQSPQGLFVENGQIIKPINRETSTYGNFYMEPNGIFGIDKLNKPILIPSSQYTSDLDLNYATQSGPMLLINGDYHPKFNKGSKNVHIRNGVGILPNGKVIFAISKERINFYDFATYFKEMGCVNALYLDGFVSRLYLPEKGYEQTDSRFGVMIGEVVDVK